MKATTSHLLSTANESNQINRTIYIENAGLRHDTALLTRAGGCGQSLYPKDLKMGFFQHLFICVKKLGTD
jgi:hypothetical protein